MEFSRLRLGLLPLSRSLLRLSRSRPSPIYSLRRQLRYTSTAPSPLLEDPIAPPPVVLRDYQEECIQSILRYLDEGHKRLGVSLATGSGKTVVFTQLINRIPSRGEYGNKTLIIVHRRELAEQAARHCRLAYPEQSVEIEMGNSVATGRGDITIASINSLASKDRILKFNPNLFKLVLVDEAHHIVARTYRMALEHFGLNEYSSDSPALVGVSATLSRFDGLKLGAAIDHIVYHKDYVDMIDENWLANAVFTTVKSEVNLSKVNKGRSGDFVIGQLSEAVNTKTTNNITVRAWLAHAAERKSTLVFCVDVNHVQELTQTFRDSGIDARYITGTTPREVRSEQLLAFQNQEYPVLLNCGLFTEGTDIPNVDCVVLARPTKSRNLLIQMIGRGLRLYPGKKNCHIIDMVASLETGVVSTPTLFGLHPDEILNDSNVADLKKRRDESFSNPNIDTPSGPPEDDVSVTFTQYDTIFDLIKDVDLEKHIRSLSRNAWVRIGESDYVLSESSGWLGIYKVRDPVSDEDVFEVRHVAKLKSPVDTITYTRPRVVATGSDLETAVHAADTFAANEFESRYIRADQAWRKSWATKNQLAILNHAKVKKKTLHPWQITRGHAADMITRLRLGGKQWVNSLEKQRDQAAKRNRELEALKRQEVKVGPVES